MLVVLLIYVSAFLFVLGSWAMQLVFQAGVGMSSAGCSAAGMLCLGAYVMTKVSLINSFPPRREMVH